jgi:hypothetical protein
MRLVSGVVATLPFAGIVQIRFKGSSLRTLSFTNTPSVCLLESGYTLKITQSRVKFD